MAISKELNEWYETGKMSRNRYTHMVVVCDTYSHEDYPVYVRPEDDIHKVIADHSKNMQKVMEVYNFSLDKSIQLKPGLINNI